MNGVKVSWGLQGFTVTACCVEDGSVSLQGDCHHRRKYGSAGDANCNYYTPTVTAMGLRITLYDVQYAVFRQHHHHPCSLNAKP